MTYRDQPTVQSWVNDFLGSQPGGVPQISVVEQYYTEGPESGLIVVQLRTASTVTSIQPVVADGVATWQVHFGPREETVALDSEGIDSLAADLSLLSQLCLYLQRRTDEAL